MAEGDTESATLNSANTEEGSQFMVQQGPKSGVKYPLKMIYIDVCDGWPLEYCEYHPNYDQAKKWMDDNLTDDMKAVYISEEKDVEGGEQKKRQKRGGKGQVKTKKKETGPKGICLSRASRGKKKYVTVVTGLATYEIDLKVASKFFGGKFACGASVTGDDEIVIQGDVKDDLFDVLPEKWGEISEDDIEDLGDLKR